MTEELIQSWQQYLSEQLPLDISQAQARLSKRAKRLSLSVHKNRIVELVIPSQTRHFTIAQFVEQSLPWIKQQLQKIPQSQNQPIQLPNYIELPLLQQSWQIHYKSSAQNRLSLRQLSHHEFLISGPCDDLKKIQQLFKNWLKRKAEQVLPPLTDELCHHTQLPIKSLSIRGQKTRWGSCSSDNKINLNYKLLFLPKELVQHVILHELAHTVHHNHSLKFWRLLQQLDPHCHLNRRALKKANQRVPAWLEYVNNTHPSSAANPL